MHYPKITLFLICFSLLIGCNPENENEGRFANCTHSDPTYTFTPEEREKLLSFPYKVGQEFSYENDEGNIITFTVEELDKCPAAYYTPRMFTIGGKQTPDYTFESLDIRLSINSIELDYEYKNSLSYYFNKNRDRFYEGLYFNLLNEHFSHSAQSQSQHASHVNWNNSDFDLLDIFDVNGQIFDQVKKYNTENIDAQNNAYLPEMPKNVNVIYFAPSFGIIQFDTVDGQSYKLTTDLNSFED